MFDAMFQPGQIGNMTVKNRLIMPPMSSRLAGIHGQVTDNMIAYYVERAKGGVGTRQCQLFVGSPVRDYLLVIELGLQIASVFHQC
jgi:2,4-dienoyl-CoA reductase-like NADH-dependent reductase (Old Yellow Enzyme family)